MSCKHIDPTKKARDFACKIAHMHIYIYACMYPFIFTHVHTFMYICIDSYQYLYIYKERLDMHVGKHMQTKKAFLEWRNRHLKCTCS